MVISMKKRFALLFAIFMLILSSCTNMKTQQDLGLNKMKILSEVSHGKKVILILADSLTQQAIARGVKENKLPALQFLIKHGQYHRDVVSSFPTMSVTIDSSLLTGTYPDKYKVSGLTWYSQKEKRVINYGTGTMEVLNGNLNETLHDAIISLNRKHLSNKVTTLFEEVSKLNLSSGVINGLVYRGTKEQVLHFPLWLSLSTSLPAQATVKGPDFFTYGAFANPLEGVLHLPTAATDRFGFNDQYAVEIAKYLVRSNQLPDFLYIYLPDLDQKSHNNPKDMEAVKKVDEKIGSLLSSFGSWAEAIQKAVIIVSGDSGVDSIHPITDKPIIELPSLLREYNVHRTGSSITDKTELVLCVNERMAYLYPLRTKNLEKLVEQLKKDSRIDLIAWQENEWTHVARGGTDWKLLYKPGGNFSDPYKQRWSLLGNANVLDLKINADMNRLEYGQYPDGLMRLYAALNSHDPNVVIITAEPGYEFIGDSSPTNIGGGGHGSLHATDSNIPVIISGTDLKLKENRIIQLKSFILEVLKSERQ